MTPILIACIILAVGAAAEIVAYVFTAKLLKKKEDGLNRRKAALDAREAVNPTVAGNTRKIVRICGMASYDLDEYAQEKEYGLSSAEFLRRKIYSAKYQVIVSLIDKITVFQEKNPDDSMTIRAELWVAEGGTDNA